MLTNMVSIAARIAALELAVIAVAEQELGEGAGHPFRGNQYSGGGGSDHSGKEFKVGDRVKSLRSMQQTDGQWVNYGEHGRVVGERSGTTYAHTVKWDNGSVIDHPKLEIEKAAPEQRHGRAQGTSSYGSDDVESFSIDDDGTVTFGDAPGHPFRGNQYGGGGGADRPHDRAAAHVGATMSNGTVKDEIDRLERLASHGGLQPSEGVRLEKLQMEKQFRQGTGSWNQPDHHAPADDRTQRSILDTNTRVSKSSGGDDRHPDDVAAYNRARNSGADHTAALDSARRSAAERNARTSGTDPSWYGQ